MACTCSCCAARVWASLNNELLIGWGSGTPCGAKPGMRTEGCAILDSSGWVVRTRGHKRVARVAVGRYDVEQPGAGVGHAEREDNGRRFAPLVASGEALHALQLPGLLVQTRQRQSLILRVEDVLHLHERRTGGVVARTAHCRAYPAEPRTRRKLVFPALQSWFGARKVRRRSLEIPKGRATLDICGLPRMDIWSRKIALCEDDFAAFSAI